jgi:BlaI family transcriptional regulator, penicillinase repressor
MMHILPTDAELEVLQVLWRLGPSTVRVVNDSINEQRTVGYTTTLKIMQIMMDKGYLTRQIIDRIHIFTASVTEKDTQTTLLTDFVTNAFQGSPSSLVMRMLGSRDTSPDELAKIKAIIADYQYK